MEGEGAEQGSGTCTIILGSQLNPDIDRASI